MGNGRPVLRHDDLELLRLLMGCPVVAGRRQQPCVIGNGESLHEQRDELLGRQAADLLVVRRNEHVEASVRAGDNSLGLEPPESSARRCVRDSKLLGDLVGREEVPTPRGPLPEQAGSRTTNGLRIHAANVTENGAFVE